MAVCLPSSYSASRLERLDISSPSGFNGWGHWALLILVMTAGRDIRGHRMARTVPLRRLFHVEILNPHPSWKGMGLNGRGYSRVMDSATDSDAACLRCWSRIRGEGSGLGVTRANHDIFIIRGQGRLRQTFKRYLHN